MRHLGEAVNDYPNNGIAINVRKVYNEIHRDVTPWSVGYLQTIEFSIKLMPSHFISLTDVIGAHVFSNKRLKACESKVALDEFVGLISSEVTCNLGIVMVLNYF